MACPSALSVRSAPSCKLALLSLGSLPDDFSGQLLERLCFDLLHFYDLAGVGVGDGVVNLVGLRLVLEALLCAALLWVSFLTAFFFFLFSSSSSLLRLLSASFHSLNLWISTSFKLSAN